MDDEPIENLYELAGGSAGIERILRTFYDAVFADVMIGYLFRSADKERLIRVETEFTARALGATDVRYSGRPMAAVHAPHHILGGQFERRAQLLREAMEAHALPAPVRTAWSSHNERLRPLVTRHAGSDCQDLDRPTGGIEIITSR